MLEEAAKLLLLVVIGAIAGFLNIMAGGGSMLTLPVLIFLGLPPAMANGTNRIAILVQNVFAVARFHRFKVIPRGVILVTSVPAIFGALIGAQLAVDIDQLLFKRVLAVVMVVVMTLTFFGPKAPPASTEIQFDTKKRLWLGLAFFAIGIYGGFIQAGIGFLIIAALSLAGYDLVKTNALKVLVVLIFTPLALGIFMINGEVDYIKGLSLAAGNSAGAWLATRFVVEKGHRFIRWIVLGAVVIFSIRLFWN